MTDTNDIRPHIRAALEAGDKSGGVMTRTSSDVVIHEVTDDRIYGRVGKTPCVWSVEGIVLTAGLHGGWNLTRPAPKRRVKGWVNVYRSDGDNFVFSIGCVEPTKMDADRAARPGRIACIEIDCEEGEGL